MYQNARSRLNFAVTHRAATRRRRRDDFALVVGGWYRSAFHEPPVKKDAAGHEMAPSRSIHFWGNDASHISCANVPNVTTLPHRDVYLLLCPVSYERAGKLVDVIGNTHKDACTLARVIRSPKKISLPLLHPDQDYRSRFIWYESLIL